MAASENIASQGLQLVTTAVAWIRELSVFLPFFYLHYDSAEFQRAHSSVMARGFYVSTLYWQSHLAPRHTWMSSGFGDMPPSRGRKDTNTIQREKCAAVVAAGVSSVTVQFIQSVNVAFAYSTASAMLNVMSGAYGPFSCLRGR